MRRIISICILSYIFTILGGTTTVNIFVDFPKNIYDQTTSSVNCAGFWPVPNDSDTAEARWSALGETMQLYWNLGENTWDYDSGAVSEPSEFIKTFG